MKSDSKFEYSALILFNIFVLLAALYNDYADEDIPDVDEDIPDVDPSEVCMEEQPADDPAVEPSVTPSTSPVPSPGSPSRSQPEHMVPLPRKPARFGRRSPPPINFTQLMRLAGGLGLAAAISAADAYTDSFGSRQDWEVPSERAGGETRRIANKRKAKEITRSAAEDFALLTTRTTSEHHAADFLSTVGNVNLLLFLTLLVSTLVRYNLIMTYTLILQRSYKSADVPYQTLRALGGNVRKAMIPDANIGTASMHEGDATDSLTLSCPSRRFSN